MAEPKKKGGKHFCLPPPGEKPTQELPVDPPRRFLTFSFSLFDLFLE